MRFKEVRVNPLESSMDIPRTPLMNMLAGHLCNIWRWGEPMNRLVLLAALLGCCFFDHWMMPIGQ